MIALKKIIPENALVESAVQALPKYRISEINKRVQDTISDASAAAATAGLATPLNDDEPPLKQAKTLAPQHKGAAMADTSEIPERDLQGNDNEHD